MNIALEDQLVECGRTIDRAIATHDDGDQRVASPSRRSRARIGVGVGAAVILMGGLVAVSIADSGTTAWANWTPTTQDGGPATVAALDAACRAEPRVGDSVDALAFDVRGDGGTAVYANSDMWAACQVELGDDGFSVSGVVSNVGDDLDTARAALGPAQPVATIAAHWQGDPAASLIWGVHDANVDNIVVSTSSGPVDATLLDDIWVAWWPTDDAETTQVRAESDGRIVADAPAGSLAAPLPPPSVIVADVEADGSAVERAAFEDGVITWDEMTSALDAWHDCVGEAGYDMSIEIDDNTQTYSASTPAVSIAGDEPDDAAAADLLAPIEAAIDQCRTTHVSRIERAFVQQ